MYSGFKGDVFRIGTFDEKTVFGKVGAGCSMNRLRLGDLDFPFWWDGI